MVEVEDVLVVVVDEVLVDEVDDVEVDEVELVEVEDVEVVEVDEVELVEVEDVELVEVLDDVVVVSQLFVQPSLLLLDDPTAGLDPTTAREILQLILEDARPAKVLVTQDVDVALPFCHDVIALDRGRVVDARADAAFAPRELGALPWQ